MRGGEFTFNPRMHEPGAQTRGRQDLSRQRLRAGPRGARRSRAPSGDGEAHRRQSSRAISSPTSRRRRWSSGSPSAFRDTDGDLKEIAKALVTAPEAWTAPRSKLKRPGEWIVAALRATGVTPPDVRPVIQAQNLLGEPLWRPTGAEGLFRRQRRLDRRPGAAARHRQPDGAAGRPRWSIRRPWSRPRSGRSPRAKRADASRAPKAGRRRSRCC